MVDEASHEPLNDKSFLKLATLNVCGLRSKIVCPEFIHFINQFDILGLQETKTDCLDDIQLHDYILHFKHRKDIMRHKSGGIALAYRKCLDQYIKPIQSSSKLVLWFTISKQLTKVDDFLCGIIYIPPEGSVYSIKDPYQEIENELYNYTDRYTHILLFGDYNSRTKELPDYIHVDPYICSHLQSEELELDYQKELSYFDGQNSHVSIKRSNQDLNDLDKIIQAQNREPSQAVINSICESFNDLILSSAEKSFGKTTGKNSKATIIRPGLTPNAKRRGSNFIVHVISLNCERHIKTNRTLK